MTAALCVCSAEAIAAVIEACKDGAKVVDLCKIGDDVINKCVRRQLLLTACTATATAAVVSNAATIRAGGWAADFQRLPCSIAARDE